MTVKASKNNQVIIRISIKDKQLIKDLGANFADIWRLGFEKWIEKIPSELQKKREYYENMLLQCNNNVITKNDDLTKFCHEYLCQGRSAENPTKLDLNWIEIKTKEMSGVSSDKFLEHAKAIPKETIKPKDSELTTYGGSRKIKVKR